MNIHLLTIISSTFAGAKKSREVVFSVLRDSCLDGDLTVPEAVEAAKDILARNSIHFYKINFANSVISSENNLQLNVIDDDLETDVSFIRIIWVDNSGQHRCRVSFLYPVSVTSLVIHSIRDFFISIYVMRCCQILFQAVPRKRFNDVVSKNGVGLAFATMGMTSFLDGPAAGSGLGAVGETRLTPDLSTKRRIPWYTSSFL